MKTSYSKLISGATISLILSILAIPALGDTPVEKEFKAMTKSQLKKIPQLKQAGDEKIDEITEKILTDFKTHASIWTEQDKQNLAAGKPLVEDFNKIKEAFTKLHQDRVSKLFIEKSQSNDLSHLQKRVFSDLYHMLEATGKKAKITSAINNAKDIYVALREYAFIHGGELPGEKNDKKTANQIFNILFEKGIVQDKEPFLLPAIDGFNATPSDAKNLAKGDNVYAINIAANIVRQGANVPLLIFPLTKNKEGKIIADKEPLAGEAVVCHLDGSVTTLKIGPKGELLTDDGKNLLLQTHPHWAGAKSDFRLPEKLEK